MDTSELAQRLLSALMSIWGGNEDLSVTYVPETWQRDTLNAFTRVLDDALDEIVTAATDSLRLGP